MNRQRCLSKHDGLGLFTNPAFFEVLAFLACEHFFFGCRDFTRRCVLFPFSRWMITTAYWKLNSGLPSRWLGSHPCRHAGYRACGCSRTRFRAAGRPVVPYHPPAFCRLHRLLTASLEAQVLAEEWHHVILEAIGDGARVRAVIELKGVRDAVLVEHFVQLDGIRAQSILIAYINGDGMILAQISDVLIDKRERRIGRPLGENVVLHNSVFRRQIK